MALTFAVRDRNGSAWIKNITKSPDAKHCNCKPSRRAAASGVRRPVPAAWRAHHKRPEVERAQDIAERA